MIAYIENDNGKYVTELVGKDGNRATIQLSDRNIPFSKFEWVTVLINEQWEHKRLIKQDKEFFYFDDGTQESKEGDLVRSKKPYIKTGYYSGLVEEYYYHPITNKVVMGQELPFREEVVIDDRSFSKDSLTFSHSYFKIVKPVDKEYVEKYLNHRVTV